MTEEGRGLVIAIDGPAASGKSTVAAALARRLGLALLDSGSMYRAVALLSVEACVDPGDSAALAALAREVSASFRTLLPPEGPARVFLGDREVTEEIRRPEVGRLSSPVSAHPGVRKILVDRQRRIALHGNGAVVEGRDMGTVVFPDAALKVFLEASVAERARRRHEELAARGVPVSLEEVAGELRARDTMDSSREHSPLAAAPDATVIDTTGLSVEQVVERIAAGIEARGTA